MLDRASSQLLFIILGDVIYFIHAPLVSHSAKAQPIQGAKFNFKSLYLSKGSLL
jgi:hypothetical protein